MDLATIQAWAATFTSHCCEAAPQTLRNGWTLCIIGLDIFKSEGLSLDVLSTATPEKNIGLLAAMARAHEVCTNGGGSAVRRRGGDSAFQSA